MGRIGAAQSAAGSTYQQVQQVTTARTATDTAVTTRLNDIENIDFADVAVRAAAANVSYQAALQTTAQVSRLSLLDFLK